MVLANRLRNLARRTSQLAVTKEENNRKTNTRNINKRGEQQKI
jgi:hypothetical protein